MEASYLDPNGGGSFTHPEITRCLYGDGKVITPLYKARPGTEVVNRGTGEIRQARYDPDASLYTEGGGNTVLGTKFAHLDVRGPEGRFIVAIEHVEKGMDEAKAALKMLRRTKPHAPGAQAVVWDMALRGPQIDEILTKIGIVPVVGVHAKVNPGGGEGRRAGTYIPKTLDLEDREVRLPDGTERIAHIASIDGAISLKELTETGEPHYEPLEVVRNQRHEDKHGFRWYGHRRLPKEYGGRVIGVRPQQTPEDDARGINRAENVRLIPEGSEDYKRLHSLRPDAESINRGIEDSLFINRASAKGWRRQMVDLLGYARLVNAITLARCRPRERLITAA